MGEAHMDKKTETIETYNNSAQALAVKFDALGARTADIAETFRCMKKVDPLVLEIGCGNGRDAEEILKRSHNYLGVDVSRELIKLARERVPGGKFEVADIVNFNLPGTFDIVFAFASLIHLNKEEFSKVLNEVYAHLNHGGVVRISLKNNESYKEVTRSDEFGQRTYYLYSESDVRELANQFSILKCEAVQLKDQKWLELLLMKK
jgi:SAM-dependent methyltransferase